MKERIFVICDPDIAYVEHLSEYLNRQPDFPFQAVPFTRPETLNAYLERSSAEVLLAAEMFLPEIDTGRNPVNTLVLTLTDTKENGICRYQSCDAILREVSAALESPSNQSSTDSVLSEKPVYRKVDSPCRVHGVYSPVGRCGKTIFAVTLGMLLSEYQSTLYLNMEGCHGFDAFADLGGTRNLSDVIYLSRMQFAGPEVSFSGRKSNDSGISASSVSGQDFSKILSGCISRWDQLCVLNPPPLSCDLYDISTEEWISLLGSIMETGEFEAIVLDIGSGMKNVPDLLCQCDMIYMPVLEDRISRGKIRQFEQTLDKTGFSCLSDRIRKVAVPRLRSDSELSAFPTQLLRGRIGSYVRHII